MTAVRAEDLHRRVDHRRDRRPPPPADTTLYTAPVKYSGGNRSPDPTDLEVRNRSMPASDADRNLLLGMLALQLDFVTRDELVESMQAWMLNKEQSLEQILLARGIISLQTHDVLLAVMEQHLQMHGDDVSQSLAALHPRDDTIRGELSAIGSGSLETPLRTAANESTDITPPVLETTDRRGDFSHRGKRFRIVRRHARGGLGEVSVAIDEELQREVALKEIRSRFADDDAARSRFVQEARVTGRLEHPGIVPVYGLGCDSNGRPFYAMQFIRGESLRQTIVRYHRQSDLPAERRRMQLRKLLSHFVDVCHTMAYVHSRGVLHRDLKPSNVMLGKFDETLVVDWGLAKVVGRPDEPGASDEPTLRVDDETPQTRLGSAVGTPAYMSPEQAAGRVDELGPASDIYSLGAILYTILTGRPPYETSDADLLARVQACDFPSPRHVNRRVPRPLEAVCLRAMASDPNSRYASTRALADDIERWLADEPIAAYRESSLERSWRWLRRHRAATVAAGLALCAVALVSSIAALIVGRQNDEIVQQNRQIRTLARAQFDARQQAEAQRDEAERAATLARTAIDEMATAAMNLRNRPLLSEAIAFYRKWIEEHADAREKPNVARTHVALADCLTHLGRFDEAETSYRRGIAIYRTLSPSQRQRQVESDHATAHGNLGNMYQLVFRIDEAEREFQRAIELERNALAADRSSPPLHLARHLLNFARSLTTTDPSSAARLLEESIALSRTQVARRPEDDVSRYYLARGLTAFGAAHYRQATAGARASDRDRRRQASRYAATAKESLEEAVTLLETLHRTQPRYPDYQKDLAVAYAEMAKVEATSGQLGPAMEHFTQADDLLELLLQQFPGDPQYRKERALVQYSLGVVYKIQQDPASSRAAYRRAIDIQERLIEHYGKSPGQRFELHQQAARSWTNLAELDFVERDFDGARKHVDQAMQHQRLAWKLASDANRQVVREDMRRTLYALAQTLISQGNHAPLVETAKQHAALERATLFEAYDAARLIGVAIGLAMKDSKLDKEQRQETVDRYGRQAVALLQTAMARGLDDPARLSEESDLAPLRSRPDFQELVRQLRANKKRAGDDE